MKRNLWVLSLLSALLIGCVQEQSVDYRATPDATPSGARSGSSSPTSKPSGSSKPAPVASKPSTSSAATRNRVTPMTDEQLPKTDAEWRKILTEDEYYVLREKGTEARYRGLWNNKKTGAYHCAGCGEHLFDSGTKFESGSGWPSFYEPATGTSVRNEADSSLGMVRTEVLCNRCGGHLGHVFDDGPRPTGLRYCINSVALQFKENDAKK